MLSIKPSVLFVIRCIWVLEMLKCENEFTESMKHD